MKNKTTLFDFFWILVVGGAIVLMLVPPMADWYQAANAAFPYLAAFVKFFLLASMGEYLAKRIQTGGWRLPSYWLGRAVIWGLLGMVIALAFQLFSGGVAAAMENGFLPDTSSRLLTAFMISTLLNLIFAPVMMGFHRFTDTWFDLRAQGDNPTVEKLVNTINWQQFFSFVVLKTIPFFWIPVHTITFLLPGEYRVLVAAMLSIALGLILSLVGKRSG
ncbi:MAG: hypothetical protein V2J07_09435 [Anaerolineae bacterium]|nr:hypothetical protein [Anaerolineae bacterium]